MSIAIPPKLAKPEVKAGPVGPGSGVLLTEFPLAGYLRDSPQKRMQKAWALSFEVPWIAAAEDAITERFSGVDWHLEDEQDETIDDAYPNRDAQAALALMERPAASLPVGAKFTRTALWALTARAMGVCGSGFIFMDSPERLAGTPSALLPIAPWRMFPDEDANGNLTGWHIDQTPTSPGIEVSVEQVMHFPLRPSFQGHFGTGLMESATRKLQITLGLDDHVNMVIGAGGRLSGILSPVQGTLGTDQMLQMERDWRTVVDQSDAAKRLQLIAAPIKFDRTTLSPQELQVRDLMVGSRDDLLTLWGVPLSIIGGTTPAGLNSGDTRKYDEAAIWQGPVHHRLTVFTETVQYQCLDLFAGRGAVVELEIEEPEFDDDSPRYDLLGKSLNTPMRNVERRALIGLPPFGDPLLDNQVVLPATIVPFADAPDESGEESPTEVALGRAPQPQLTAGDEAATAAAGETPTPAAAPAKAAPIHERVRPLHASLGRYREHAQQKYTPLLKSAVQEVLHAQRHDIAAKLRKHAAHITADPHDTSAWFSRSWDAKLRAALAPRLEAVAHVVNGTINDVLPAKAAPVGAVERVMERGAARVTKINDTTRAKIQEAIIRGLDEGLSVLEVADLIESGDDVGGLSMGSMFDDYRAEMIARTELMDAYNATAIASYSDAGVTQVQAIDGDGDEECAARDGQTFDVEEADAIEDHPNGTLDWVPVIGEEAKAVMAAPPVGVPVTINFAPGAFQNDVHVPAPIVSNVVNVPDQPTPNVIVAPTVVDVHPTPIVNNLPAPSVTILSPEKPTRRIIDRDRNGNITGSHDA